MNDTQKKIFVEAKKLFENKGYYHTTVREITSNAGVNLGLFNYYFQNKYNLAKQFYDSLFENIKKLTFEKFDHVDNPAIKMGIMMRMHTYGINNQHAIKFTIDALKEGIFDTSMMEKGKPLIANINNYYDLGLSKEQLNIILAISLSAERVLITQAYYNHFTMNSEQIADYTLNTHLRNFGLDTSETNKCFIEVHKNFQMLLDNTPDFARKIVQF